MPKRKGADSFIPPTALYIHVPICASKCAYCDFYSLPASALPRGFEDALVEQTLDRARALAARFGASEIKTVYIGGGTPTMLSANGMDSLLRGIAGIVGGGVGRRPLEWTVEANPDSLGEEGLRLMADRGVTRLSVGVQSLDSRELALLGRRHSPAAALAALRLAASSGLELSADLITGIPRPKLEFWASREGGLASFARAIVDAGASHISVYDLTIEEGTPIAARKDLAFPTEDEAWEERCLLQAALSERGLRRYEVSNYSRPGRECFHNLAYWRMDSYIGAGPGAVSTLAREDGGSLRIEEAKDARNYRESEARETTIAPRDAAFETIMMSFRTVFGLDLEAFQRRFGRKAEELIGESLSRWSTRIVAGSPWPIADGRAASLPTPGREDANPALDGEGLDILNRFLGDCLVEIEGASWSSQASSFT
jgi:oxygen-independent coproporphyrinogen III oxidase